MRKAKEDGIEIKRHQRLDEDANSSRLTFGSLITFTSSKQGRAAQFADMDGNLLTEAMMCWNAGRIIIIITGRPYCPLVGKMPHCLALSSARSCPSRICPGRLSATWVVSLVVCSCRDLQVVTGDVHISSLRWFICPAQDHFIFLTLFPFCSVWSNVCSVLVW